MRKLLVAGLMVVLASPAFAAIQNVKVSGDITTSWINDSNFDLGTNTGLFTPSGQKKQNVFLTQTRLRVDADLSDNVSTTVGLINERAWNAENCTTGTGSIANGNCDTNVQLYLASLTLREFLYSPLTVQIGRQVFNYGNGLILGDGGPINAGAAEIANVYADLNERTAYDGVTTTLDYKPLTISMIYFKNGQTNGSIQGLGHLTSGQSSDVYGYNANYQLSDPWSTVVEQYTFARFNGVGYDATLGTNGNDTGANMAAAKGNTMYVPGLRASTNPTKSLNLQGEIAWELGNVEVNTGSGNEGEHRDAMAAQFLATYTLPLLEKYKPSVNASYTYVSGDKNGNVNYPADAVKSAKTYTAWDEFNTIQGAGTIYRAIFPLSNESIVAVGASASPLEDVTAGFTWSGIWSVAPYNSAQNPLVLIQPDGSPSPNGTVTPTTNKNGYWVGNETDLNLTYNYTEDVTFGLTVGWFVPGDVFTARNNETASQAIANVGVKF
jgi:hypothetical protein